ncbi:MAG: hypothetical protein IJ188_08335 [Clostridia bacterium]|nr:hypothetical protein [Clostridia bacterium]
MEIERSIDIENAIRIALKDYINIYCRPLPDTYKLPNILVSQVGGSNANKIDTFEIVLDSRARNNADALDYLMDAIGILKGVAGGENTPILHVSTSSAMSWGNDPVRPDLKMCSARMSIVAHMATKTIKRNGGKQK